MAETTTATNFTQQEGGVFYPNTDSFPVAAAAKIIKGTMVGLIAGYAKSTGLIPAAGGPEIQIVGRAEGTGSSGTGPLPTKESDVDNTTGAAGDKFVRVTRGIFLLKNSAGVEALTVADVMKPCYLVDHQTVSRNSNNGKRPVAGIVFGVPGAVEAGGASGVYVQIGKPNFNRISINLIAGADLTLFQYGFVKMSAGKVIKVAADTDPIFGVLQNAPNNNEVAEIVTYGPSFIKAGAANITTSVNIGSDANGLGKDLAANKRLGAYSQEAILAGAVGMVYVMPGGSVL